MPAKPRLKITLPEDPLNHCAYCGEPRKNRTKGWHRIADADGVHVGWSGPGCPMYGEPIRRVVTARGLVRYRWRASVTPPGTNREVEAKGTSETLEQARLDLAAARERIRGQGRWERPTVLTVAEMCAQWIKYRRVEAGSRGGIREVSVNGYESSLHRLLTVIGEHDVATLTPGTIEAALRTISAPMETTVTKTRTYPSGNKTTKSETRVLPGLKHRSVSYALGTLRQVYKHAVREGWVTADPAAAAKAPRREAGSEPPKMLRWTPAQLKAFRATADTYAEGERYAAEPWLRAAMRLSLCGLRRSEVLGLDWEHVHLDTGTVDVRQGRVKTGRGRETVLGPVKTDAGRRTVRAEEIHSGTAKALRELWLTQGRPETGLVVLDRIGEWVHPDTYSRRWKGLCDEAGVPVLARIHNIRHSVATALDEAGVARNHAAALLGHDQATYERFYLPLSDDGAAEAAVHAGRIFA